ncbi:MAG: hypothetical protein K6G40_04230 [Eubacterium sp.]|nr:hypothetical protein [Eubacterium sp.]
MKNFSGFRFSAKQRIVYTCEAILLTAAIGEAFYGSFTAGIVLSPIALWFLKRKKRICEKRELENLKEGFKECLLLVMAAVNVGYSFENAWKASLDELMGLLGKEHIMVKKLGEINARLAMNENIESVLEDFASASGMEEAGSFCEVMKFAKRSGGNYRKIIRRSVLQIREKIEVESEIRTLTAGKRMEQRIMSLLPLGICLYLKASSPGYLDVLYGNVKGMAVMTLLLVMYAAAFVLSEKIVDIEV